ncbi:hypothetical protein GGI42DRAFT_367572 [Trichoderma sp. SZMC 28013]
MTLHGSDTTPQNAACDPSPGREDRVDLEPILHFNLTSSPPATVLEPPTTLDMEHPLFNNDERSVFGDYSSFFYQNDGFGHAAPYANMAVNDDTRLLQGMSARLSSLEAAIAGGNTKIAHLDNRIMGLVNKAEEIEQSISALSQTMKDFLIAFVTKIFGNQTSERDGGV